MDLVEVTIKFRQSTDGRKYQGETIFDGVSFYYLLNLKVSPGKIYQILNSDKGIAGIKRVTNLTVKKTKKNDKPVRLSKELWSFFTSMMLKVIDDPVARFFKSVINKKVTTTSTIRLNIERFPALARLIDRYQ